MLDFDRQPSPSQLRRFALTMCAAFGATGLLAWFTGRTSEAGWGWAGTPRQVIAVVCWLFSAAFAVLPLLGNARARTVYVGWMSGSRAIGAVMSTILLGLLFFVLLPVFSLIRLSDPLRRRTREGSYWEAPAAEHATLERMSRLF